MSVMLTLLWIPICIKLPIADETRNRLRILIKLLIDLSLDQSPDYDINHHNDDYSKTDPDY